MEISIIYKSVTGGVVQLGLPERRVSDTLRVEGNKVKETVDILMGVALRRLENAEASGSIWTFHSFVSVTMRASTNVTMNSDLVNEQIGGNEHGEYILSQAEEDGGITADDEEEEEDDDDDMGAFIDDREVEGDDVPMYREVDEVVDRDQVIATPKAAFMTEFNLSDYKIPDDETIDLLSGEDSDHIDRELRGESTWEEACDVLGVTLAPDQAASMNAAIDKVTISSNGEAGSCTYRAVLNGIFARKFNINKVVTEERFATCLPDIYRVVSAYKEALQYVTVGKVAAIMDTLNDQLVKMGYAINIYERKPKTFLIDVITNQQQNKSFMISVVQAMYLYDDLGDLVADQIHLMFKRMEGTRILDMGACTDISVIIKALRNEKTKTANFRLRKLYICERCRVCYIRKSVYTKHVQWCKGLNSQQFVFEKKQDFETFEEFVRCRDTPLVTAYYDLETETSHEEFKVISFSYVIAFRTDLCMSPIIVFRSAIMDVGALTLTSMPSEVKDCMDDSEDLEKITMCAHDVIRQRPHAMTQLLVMELVTLQRAIARAMENRAFIYAYMSLPDIDDGMVDYCAKKCYLCGFGLNNTDPIPFRECVVFFLHKLYLEEYCQTVVERPDPNEWSEDKLVSVWLEAMEKTYRGESTFTNEKIAEEKLRLGLESFHVSHCSLVIRATYPHHRLYMTGTLEHELLNILNDDVVVHHCHYTGTVYGPVHKRCNSKVKIDPYHMKLYIYAHNATFFDNAFILKGINLSLLVEKADRFPIST